MIWDKYLVGYIPAPGPGKRSLPPTGLTGGYIILQSKPEKEVLAFTISISKIRNCMP